MINIADTVIELIHSLTALIIAITALITSLVVHLKWIKDVKKGYSELKEFFKRGGKLKMTKSVKIFLIVILCFSIGFIILVTIGVTEPTPTLNAPFDVTLYFYPGGWMGDPEIDSNCIKFNDGFTDCNRPANKDGICIKIEYRPIPKDQNGKGWAGIYWQYPDKNWGDKPGRKVREATRIVFYAKGETGNEVIEVKAGGINDYNKKYQDSFEIAQRIRLTNNWERYEISISDQDLSNVIGSFAWVASRNANPDGLTFYLDDIRYE